MRDKSDHCDGEFFFNSGGGRIQKGFGDFLKWQLRADRRPWPKWVENRARPSVRSDVVPVTEAALTFINHVTFLIQTNGLNILTDPVYSQRVSPSQLIGPKRVRAPGLPFEQMPKIDVVLVSHNHYDHMDLPTLRKLQRKFEPTFLTPLGNAATLRAAGIAKIVETDWWDVSALGGTAEGGGGTDVITVPAQHWSGRGLRDRNRALWCGFVIQTSALKIYFAGDTGYGPHFGEIHKRLGVMDVSLLPIGAYEPRWFMREQHMNPDDAVRAHADLHTRASIGTHFGAFRLTDEAFDDPVKDLETAIKKNSATGFSIMEVGESRTVRADRA